MSQDLKAKNRELRNIVDQEKASLETKIEGKMARTLEAAVQDRMATQKKLTSVENEVQARNREVQDLKNQL